MGKKTIHFVDDLIKENEKLKTQDQFTPELKTDKNLYFKQIPLVHAMSNYWKITLTEKNNKQPKAYLKIP